MIKDKHNRGAEDKQSQYVTSDQLCIGLYVHLDLGWMQHPFAFSNFKIKDEEQISKIRALNLKKIRYDPKRSDVVPVVQKPVQVNRVQPATPSTRAAPTPSALARRTARLRQLNDAVLDSERAFDKNVSKVRETVRNLSHHPEHCREAAEKMVAEWANSVITESDVVLHAISGSKSGHENFFHPFNVTVLALMVAKSLDMSEDEASILGMAGMFHDAGKEEAVKNKSFIDLHCEVSAGLAERSGMSERVARVILQHHEYMDGSGYPGHLKGDAIDPLARVLALVNHFDNLCNPNNPSSPTEAMTPYEALSVMYATQQHKFDSKVLRVLVKSLGVYPPGSIVQLSNELYGIVVATNPDKPMLPVVMIYLPKVARETPVIIDLAEEENITIKKCLRPDRLPKEVFDYLRPRKRVSYYFLKKGDAPEEPLVTKVSPQGEGVQTDMTLSTRQRQA